MSSRPTRTELLAFVALLAMTAAWGSTFFMIKDIVTRMAVLDLLAVRFAIAAVALLLIAGRRLRDVADDPAAAASCLGLLYGIAQILQTAGLAHTSASVSGFITGLYVVATPLLGALILRTRIPAPTWLAAVLATVGLGVLSLNGFSIGYGELLTLASAIVYAGHIVALGRLSGPGTAHEPQRGADVRDRAAVFTGGAGADRRHGTGIQLPTSGTDWLIVIYLARRSPAR